MNINEIKAKMDEIKASNEHWKSCQDGSYEMALHMDGYWDLKKQYDVLIEAGNE
jgi:hypothetical protein